MPDVNKQITDLALQNDVTYVGVAGLEPAHNAILEQDVRP
jgi:methylmalonyl-CoA mutase cobalamin-binding subunit